MCILVMMELAPYKSENNKLLLMHICYKFEANDAFPEHFMHDGVIYIRTLLFWVKTSSSCANILVKWKNFAG